eukprot:CAMPEP_0170340332 /NCGR_PEP_ID=MMETSP0116_2-20130129/71268_1 /TAXON_ID=400756 /ORGANISM="Durinskia baltica, Strain CSIRO CS-38" /LENGTH=54 /DNA_ID=CAMNT_0010593839 /DNA_START=73 /DNA_END=233 /DNA_ORIENTATION=+
MTLAFDCEVDCSPSVTAGDIAAGGGFDGSASARRSSAGAPCGAPRAVRDARRVA